MRIFTISLASINALGRLMVRIPEFMDLIERITALDWLSRLITSIVAFVIVWEMTNLVLLTPIVLFVGICP